MSLSDPTVRLRQLHVFAEVASRRSFVRAAEALGITQPATSRTIRQLEEALGVRLLERSRRGVRLTPEGEAFRHHAGAALASVQRGISSVRGIADDTRYFRIGALPTVAGGLVPAAVEHVRATGMRARLRIVTGPQALLVGQLKEGHIDVLVGRMPPPESMQSLSFERLYGEQIVLAARHGHPMCSQQASFGDLTSHTVLIPTPTAVIRPEVDRLLLGLGIASLEDVIETVSPSFSLAYLERTDAVWLISRSVVAGAVARGQLALVPLDTGVAFGPIGLSTLRDGVKSPLLDTVVASFRYCASQLYPPE